MKHTCTTTVLCAFLVVGGSSTTIQNESEHGCTSGVCPMSTWSLLQKQRSAAKEENKHKGESYVLKGDEDDTEESTDNEADVGDQYILHGEIMRCHISNARGGWGDL